jgi:hypothetical protein
MPFPHFNPQDLKNGKNNPPKTVISDISSQGFVVELNSTKKPAFKTMLLFSKQAGGSSRKRKSSTASSTDVTTPFKVVSVLFSKWNDREKKKLSPKRSFLLLLLASTNSERILGF